MRFKIQATQKSGAVACGNVHEEPFLLPRHRGKSQYMTNVSRCSGRIMFRCNDNAVEQISCFLRRNDVR